MEEGSRGHLRILALFNHKQDEDFILYAQQLCDSLRDPLLHDLPVDLLPIHRKRVLRWKLATLEELALLAAGEACCLLITARTQSVCRKLCCDERGSFALCETNVRVCRDPPEASDASHRRAGEARKLPEGQKQPVTRAVGGSAERKAQTLQGRVTVAQ